MKEKATTLEHRNSFLEGQVERLRKKKERKAEVRRFLPRPLSPLPPFSRLLQGLFNQVLDVG